MIFDRADAYIGRSLDLYGEYVEQEVELYRKIVKPDFVVVEGGANIGALTLPLANLAGPSGKVYAFEPQRPIFHMLCGNLALNQIHNVDARLQGLGDKPGTLHLPEIEYSTEEYRNYGGFSLAPDGDGEPVEVVTIDSLKLDRCDFIKLDVEGMEKQALEGAANTVARFRPLLYVENSHVHQKNRDALLMLIKGLGYEFRPHSPSLFDKDNFRRNTTNEFLNYTNSNILCHPL